MANGLNEVPVDDIRSATTAGADPIFEVTGVPAREILLRCSEIRHHGRHGIWLRSLRTHVAMDAPPSAPCLLDLADLSDEDFIHAVHGVLLGRAPSPLEAARRVGELGRGSSRMEIIVRLALSPEGRRASRPRARGIGLPALAVVGRTVEAAQARPVLGGIVRAGERVARAVLHDLTPHSRFVMRVARLGAVGGAAIGLDRWRRRKSLESSDDPPRRTR